MRQFHVGFFVLSVFCLLLICSCNSAPNTSTVPAGNRLSGNQPAKIDSLNPNSASKGVALDVKISGSGFDEGSFVFFGDADVYIKTTFVSDQVLVAHLTNLVTASSGTYSIKVHTGKGDLTNSVEFAVTP